MDPGDETSLREFARRHHVHYEVEPEEVTGGREDGLVGLRLRLLATHERARLEAPACPACVELLDELRGFAERVVADAGLAERAETIPAPRKLYASAEDRNGDEVALTIRVRCDRADGRPGDRRTAAVDRCLGALRERLADAGVGRP